MKRQLKYKQISGEKSPLFCAYFFLFSIDIFIILWYTIITVRETKTLITKNGGKIL